MSRLIRPRVAITNVRQEFAGSAASDGGSGDAESEASMQHGEPDGGRATDRVAVQLEVLGDVEKRLEARRLHVVQRLQLGRSAHQP